MKTVKELNERVNPQYEQITPDFGNLARLGVGAQGSTKNANTDSQAGGRGSHHHTGGNENPDPEVSPRHTTPCPKVHSSAAGSDYQPERAELLSMNTTTLSALLDAPGATRECTPSASQHDGPKM
jgi:hypothetical protein